MCRGGEHDDHPGSPRSPPRQFRGSRRYDWRAGAGRVDVNGEEVITTWAGIAGAGVGVAACLPQAPGVIRAEYPSEEDLKVGGARTNHVRIISPRYEKICFGIDDTDTKQEGATWVLALKCAEACHIEGVEFLNMRLVQLNPAVPSKTTNCVGSALNFAARPSSIEALREFVCTFVEEHTFSKDTGIAFIQGIGTVQDSPVFKSHQDRDRDP